MTTVTSETSGTSGTPGGPGPSAYRQVLTIPGAVPFSAAGLVARLPISMIGLGIVILVSSRTGSYSAAGTISATYVAMSAVTAVPLARLVDRRGQGEVLGLAASVSSVGLALLAVAVEAGWPVFAAYVFAGLAGAAMPNVGAAVRARWSHAVHDRRLLDTAFAVEAVNDELVFIVGPTVTTLLATAVHPVAGLVAAGTAALVGTWSLVALHGSEPPRRSPDLHVSHSGPMPWGQLAPLVSGAVMLGILFGGSEVATVAFADEAGSTRSAGVLAMALLMAPLPFVDHLVVLGGFLFLAGFAISPTMIAAVSWVEQIVPRDRLNEGMTVFTTGLVVGVAPGAAIVGAIVDRAGASPSYFVPAAAGALGALVAFLGSDRLK